MTEQEEREEDVTNDGAKANHGRESEGANKYPDMNLPQTV